MQYFLCRAENQAFVTNTGAKLNFTTINQQDMQPPEKGLIPAVAFENKTVLFTGRGEGDDGSWVYSSRVVAVLDVPIGVVLNGIEIGNG